MNNKNITKSLSDNEAYLKKTFGESADIIYRHFIIPMLANRQAFIIYVDGLVGASEMDDSILMPLIARKSFPSMETGGDDDIAEDIMKAGVLAPSVKISSDFNEICDSMLSGDTALFIENSCKALIISTRGWSSRSVSEPITESEVRGAKDSFIESIRTNTSLIRRRIKDYNLRFESYKIGKRTKTDIALAYIDNLVDKGILEELRKRLDRIDIDSVIESGYIEELIEDAPKSIFPQIEHTERPDKACASILEGRIAIIVDNTPFVLLVPTVFWQFLQATGDYYEKYYIGSFLRWLRLFALVLSMIGSSVYVMLASYHQEMIPTALALRMAAGREGLPFPAVAEAFLMEIMFEIMREAGLRMPKNVGQAVSIVGALVIGDAAVNAGLVGPVLVIAVAASGICSFAIPSYATSFIWRISKIFVLLSTGFLGVLGLLGSTIFISLHLLSLRSFGAPFLAPLDPFYKRGAKDVMVRAPWWLMKKRPRVTQPQDVEREARQGLKPEPPSTGD